MKSAARTIKVFGTYVAVTGLGLLLIPNLWLAPLGFPPTQEIWVRVVGVVDLAGAAWTKMALASESPA